MLCSLCVKWEVFNTTGLACGLDSALAEVTPFAGAALYHKECWWSFGELWLLGGRSKSSHRPCLPPVWGANPGTSALRLLFNTWMQQRRKRCHTPAPPSTHPPLASRAAHWWMVKLSWKPQHPPNRDSSMCECIAVFLRTKWLLSVPPRCGLPMAFCWQEGETSSLWGGLIRF